MSKKLVFAVLLLSVLVFLTSCKIVSLSEAERAAQEAQFDPKEYAEAFWSEKLIKHFDEAIDANILFEVIAAHPEEAKEKYSRSVGLGGIYYYFVRGKGKVLTIEEDRVGITIKPQGDKPALFIATDYIFGNTICNATGLLDRNDFSNSQDFNNISGELNNIVATRVLPPFLEEVQTGMMVEFVGCARIASDEDLYPMLLIPVSLKLSMQ